MANCLFSICSCFRKGSTCRQDFLPQGSLNSSTGIIVLYIIPTLLPPPHSSLLSLTHSHRSLETCPTADTLAPQPSALTATLFTHQQRALAWLLWRERQTPSGGILADEMGLGKTLSMIALILQNPSDHSHHSDGEATHPPNFKAHKSNCCGRGLCFHEGIIVYT